MGAEKTQDIRWLRSKPTPGGFSADNIDAEAGIIRDVVMVQEGEARGHGLHLEAEFVRDIVAYDNRTFGTRGLKARFGHPSMSNETMGTQLGVFHNFRERKENGLTQAIADLHLLDAAEESPTHPGMRSWVLKMAAERPDFIMSSIVFAASGYYQKKKNGHKREMNSPYDADPELGDVFVIFGEDGKHFATDLVEEGAATENLFSNHVNPHLFVAQADQFLYDHPELKKFIQANPEKVTAFFGSIGIPLTTQPAKNMADFKLFDWLMGNPQEDSKELAAVRTALEEAKQTVSALNTEKEAAENRAETAEQERDTAQGRVGDLETELSAAKDRIAELEATPAAPHSGGPTDGAPATKHDAKTQEVYNRYGIK